MSYMLFGAGRIGKRMLELLGANKILCFIDNKKANSIFHQKPVLPLKNAKEQYPDAEIIVSIKEPQYLKEVLDQLASYGGNYITFNDFFLQYIAGCKTSNTVYYMKYKAEIDYMLMKRRLDMIPYPLKDKYLSMKIELSFDVNTALYKFCYCGKPIFFPKGIYDDIAVYIQNLLAEQDDNSPHRYFTSNHHVCLDDIFIDVGGAEALTSLEVIDKVKKVYIFEGNPKWWSALTKTFEPYGEKVVIVKKFLSDQNSDRSVTMDEYFKDISGNLFIKVDIEGSERFFLRGAEGTLKRCGVRISLCTYHKHEDSEEFYSLLSRMGYKCDFSKGYLFVNGDFEKGVLYASNDI